MSPKRVVNTLFSLYVSSEARVGPRANRGTRSHPAWSTSGPNPSRRISSRSGGPRGRCVGGTQLVGGTRGRRCKGSGRGPPSTRGVPSPQPRRELVSSRRLVLDSGCTARPRRTLGRELRLDRFWTSFFAPEKTEKDSLALSKSYEKTCDCTNYRVTK